MSSGLLCWFELWQDCSGETGKEDLCSARGMEGGWRVEEASEGFVTVDSGVVKTEVEQVAKYLGLGDDLALYS